MKPFFQNSKVVGFNVDPSSYHKREHERGEPAFVMSQTELKNFIRCPSRWRSGFESDLTDSIQFGSLVDCLLFTPNEFKIRFAVEPETYRNDKGEEKPWSNNANVCKAWKADHEDFEIVSSDDVKEAQTAVEKLMLDRYVNDLLHGAQFQVHVQGEYADTDTGIIVPVRCLMDILPSKDNPDYGKCLADYKTARTASVREWPKHLFSLGYHIQAALEIDLYTAATGEDRTDFYHVIQENFPPYEVGRRILDSEFIEIGRHTYQTALRVYCRCIKDNRWPGYDDMVNDGYKGWSFSHPDPWMMNASLLPSTRSLPTPPTPEPQDDITP